MEELERKIKEIESYLIENSEVLSTVELEAKNASLDYYRVRLFEEKAKFYENNEQ